MAESPEAYAAIHPDLQAALIDAWHLLPRIQTVGADTSFKDLYTLIDYVSDAVRLAFPDIPCKSGCSNCCVDYGLPRTTAREWAAIHTYMQTEMPAEIRQTVLAANQRLYGDQVPDLLLERQRIQVPHTDPRAGDNPLPAFACLQCPCLVEGRCSIYPVRPAICRAFGSFSVRMGERLQAFTCRMAADVMQEVLSSKNIAHWALPVWGRFEERLYELNDGYGDVASLPLWLLAHMEGGELVVTLETAPDFERLVTTGA
ncbi:MAG: YkgJ family cysteine cluster protein [Candidatus Sericytochromatia bacterium]|nr:YkgJ family cysteine cluster protein [Candidatus Sericytochromatia bacterium]